MTYKRIVDCDCGFNVEITDTATTRKILKVLRAHDITVRLFGCDKCRAEIKKQIEKYETIRETFMRR